MNTDSEGIILRNTKTLNGRTMITVFSQKYGKISAGTSISERGRNKTALALRPFCYGRYELFKNRDLYNINGAETIRSHYSFGEDVDKYMAASYVLELTDAMIGEGEPQPAVYKLLLSFLDLLEARKAAFGTLVIAYQIKSLDIMGSGLNLKECVRCSRPAENADHLSVEDGGLLCRECLTPRDELDPLIFSVSADIIHVLRYMQSHSLESLRELAVSEKTEKEIRKILKQYIAVHLGIDHLKSEGLII